MPLKIIGAGFGRTGTLSLCTALNQLGFPCYHMTEILENKANASHLDFWYGVANTAPDTPHPWEAVFAAYTAAVDNPACCVWRDLASAYPDAKIVLTTHPKGPQAWYESTIDTIYFTENTWQFRVLELFTPFGRKFGRMSRELIWARSLKGTMPDRDKAVARYQRHVEELKAEVPPDRLLVFSVDQGWEPLCRFLGVAVPAQPFPNVNDRAEIKKTLARMFLAAYGILAAVAVGVAMLAWALWSVVS